MTKKDLKQWYFKITDYADRLLDGREAIKWPESIKSMQRNWIGRSEGVEVNFEVQKRDSGATQIPPITTFTTRPDTLFGVTMQEPGLSKLVSVELVSPVSRSIPLNHS